jgi:hypothetical protein
MVVDIENSRMAFEIDMKITCYSLPGNKKVAKQEFLAQLCNPVKGLDCCMQLLSLALEGSAAVLTRR